MKESQYNNQAAIITHFFTLIVMVAFAAWLKGLNIESPWQETGLTTFSLGFLLLASYVSAQLLKSVNLPLISGYIFTGIIAGPYLTGFLSDVMVDRLSLVNDFALSFIALTAGGTLQIGFLRERFRAIIVDIILQAVIIFVIVLVFVIVISRHTTWIPDLSQGQIIALAALLGVISVARSPSSAIAIISECRASGRFTSTVLGVTVAMDVLIIIFFTLALTISKIFLSTAIGMDYQAFMGIFFAVVVSLVLGLILGKIISIYIEKIGHDLPLFLLFFAFGIFKISLWLNVFMEGRFGISLNLEPLLICMSAGFSVQNFSGAGSVFMDGLERISLPIYVLFFSLAGASLNLEALRIAWPLALSIAMVRGMSIFASTWLAGLLNRETSSHRNSAWLAYLTQAGVSIGLAQMAQRHFPEVGVYLTTVVLAVITINQVVGPVGFKMALARVGEMYRR